MIVSNSFIKMSMKTCIVDASNSDVALLKIRLIFYAFQIHLVCHALLDKSADWLFLRNNAFYGFTAPLQPHRKSFSIYMSG